jgi:hypothetical protein
MKAVEEIKAHTLFLIIPPPPPKKKNCAVYEIIWKNVVEPDRPQMTI